jgi:SAM-dependent methyltransferase
LAADWQDLDASADLARALDFLDELAALPEVRTAKDRSFDLLRARPGGRILDAGCGTGVDALLLLERVLPGGEVVGVDSSAVAIATARARAAERPSARFECADISSLPFPDGAFDGARADRTLLHVPEPERAVRELARVVRPGGAIVLSEATFADAGGGSTGSSSASRSSGGRRGGRRVLEFLPFLLHQAGVAEIALEHRTCTIGLTERLRDTLDTAAASIELRVVHVYGSLPAGPS